MFSYWLCLFSGIGTGVLFAYLKLPIPAPLHIAGILGIIGLYLGYSIVKGEFQ